MGRRAYEPVRMTTRLWKELGFVNIDAGQAGNFWSHADLGLRLDVGSSGKIRYVFTLECVVNRMLYAASQKKVKALLGPIKSALEDISHG